MYETSNLTALVEMHGQAWRGMKCLLQMSLHQLQSALLHGKRLQ